MSFPILDTDPSDKPFHPTLEQTAARAAHWHASQVDQAGRPYVEHLIEVAAGLVRLFPDANGTERHAAWLHDVIEDTDITAEDLARLGYAAEVIAIVTAVTRPDGAPQPYADWIAQMAETAPLGALRVKLADLASNTDPHRLARLDPAKAGRLSARYTAATAVLRKALLDRAGGLDDKDPEPADLIPLTVHLEPIDFFVLGEAATMAQRSAQDFMTEEALDLAHRIIATGRLHHVELARQRQKKAAAFMDAFRASSRSKGPLSDFQPPRSTGKDDPAKDD
jgi:uncharacterized protein (DUF1778 family)